MKISRILPTTPRLEKIDLEEKLSSRPGSNQFGRLKGFSPPTDQIQWSYDLKDLRPAFVSTQLRAQEAFKKQPESSISVQLPTIELNEITNDHESPDFKMQAQIQTSNLNTAQSPTLHLIA